MAYDKVVDSAQLDGALTATADAIRDKTGGTEQIAWDAGTGFAAAIAAITSGGGESGGVGVESGEFIPGADTRQVDIEVSQAAHDGCKWIYCIGDQDDISALDVTTLQAMYACVDDLFYMGNLTGYIDLYSSVRKLTSETSPGFNGAVNNYFPGVHIDESKIRLGGGSAVSYFRAGVTYRWYVYYSKEASA